MNKRLLSGAMIVMGLLVLAIGIYEHFRGNEGLAAGAGGATFAAAGFAMRKKLKEQN